MFYEVLNHVYMCMHISNPVRRATHRVFLILISHNNFSISFLKDFKLLQVKITCSISFLKDVQISIVCAHGPRKSKSKKSWIVTKKHNFRSSFKKSFCNHYQMMLICLYVFFNSTIWDWEIRSRDLINTYFMSVKLLISCWHLFRGQFFKIQLKHVTSNFYLQYRQVSFKLQ